MSAFSRIIKKNLEELTKMSSSEKTIERLTKTIEAMSNELALLREQVAYLTKNFMVNPLKSVTITRIN